MTALPPPANPANAWHNGHRAELDAAYNNAAAVHDSAAIVADWDARSAALRTDARLQRDLRYGPAPRQCLDLLVCDARAPTVVFFHGGYWQMRAKENFTFIAEGLRGHGINVALVGYSLAPQVTMDAIVAECHAALHWLDQWQAAVQATPSGLHLAGWSAGAHLATMVLHHPSVRSGLAISGIYDLEPLRHCYLNDKLQLDAASARRNSPRWHTPTTAPRLTVVVGGHELPELRRQSLDFAQARRAHGLDCPHLELAGAHHFSVLESLAAPNGVLNTRLRAQLLTH